MEKKLIETWDSVDGEILIYQDDNYYYLENEFYDDKFKTREALDRHLEANGAFKIA